MKANPSILANLPCGRGGLNANFNTFRVPITHLVRATNIRFDNLAINKAPGLTALGNAVSGAPTCLGGITFDVSQASSASVTAWSNGNVYKESSNQFDTVNLGAFGASSEPVVFVPFSNLAEAGTPESNRLAIFAKGTAPRQVVGNAGTFTTFTAVSADWASANAPMGGCMHDFRLIAYGVSDYPHNIYFSTLTNLSDFTGSGSKVMSVFPGEGVEIRAAISYLETTLAVFKKKGIYLVDTTDLTLPVNPAYRVTDAVGVAGPNALCKVNGDIWFVSDQGHIHSLTQLRGDIDPLMSNLTHQLQLTEYVRRNIDLSRLKWARLVFDQLRQEVIFAYTTLTGTTINNECMIFKLASPENPILVSLDTREEAYNAVWTRYDSTGNMEVLCAGGSGQVHQFNATANSVNGSAFTGVYSHPTTDFSYLDPSLASKEKSFKFLQLQILPSGANSTMSFDIIVDGIYRRTETVNLSSSGNAIYGTSLFGTGTYAGTDYTFKQVPLDVTGQKLQLICYNSQVDETFSVVDMTVVFDLIEGIHEDV